MQYLWRDQRLFLNGANYRQLRFLVMPVVQSLAIEAVAYDEAARRLRAKFRADGQVVVYENVPQDVYDSLIFADSIGDYFRDHIQGAYPSRVIDKGKMQ